MGLSQKMFGALSLTGLYISSRFNHRCSRTVLVSVYWVFVGKTIDEVKNGAATSFLQIREGLPTNRGLKPKAKKKKKGDTRQCQTGRRRDALPLTAFCYGK